ncbi:hypothetical protein Lepto7375DRAFT_5821 [Leptolyngbya sp. PCC 7375]|nr:hypothetical protein Lepto7375DRAFT_5821 [Leptolyngbya sp. PCC 7375]
MKFSTLLSSSLLAGAVFAVATLPIAAIRSDSIEVKLQDKSFFSSDFQELALPYLSGVTFVSLGAGFTVLTLGGWRQASKKLDKTQATINQLQQEMDEKKAALEKLRFSEKQLNKIGLDAFLHDDVSFEKLQTEPAQQFDVAHVKQPQSMSSESHAAVPQTTDGPPSETLSSFQENTSNTEKSDASEESLQLNHLLTGLQHITSQIEVLQAAQANSSYQKV